MSIKLADTLVPMNETYPAVRAEHVWFDDDVTLEEKINDLGGNGGSGTIDNIVTTIDSTVTHDQVASAKASYDYFAKREIYGETTMNLGRKPDSIVGEFSGAIGKNTVASGKYSVAMGENATSTGMYTLSKGNGTTASGDCSSAEGYCTHSSGMYSHAEGANSESRGWYSHAESNDTLASGDSSHAEGKQTVASGDSSHAQGEETQANGKYSHAQGRLSIANGQQSTAMGLATIANGNSQTVLGKFNVADNSNVYAMIVGGGTGADDRNNLHTIDWTGNAKYKGDVVATSIDGKEISLLELANASGVGSYIGTVRGNNSKSITVIHQLNSQYLVVKTYEDSTGREVIFDVSLDTPDVLTLYSDIVLTSNMVFTVVVTL